MQRFWFRILFFPAFVMILIQLQHAFSGRNTDHSRIKFQGLAKGPGGGFEDAFHNMMGVLAVVTENVQIEGAMSGHGSPKFFGERGVEGAQHLRWNTACQTQKGRPLKSTADVTKTSSIGSVALP